jgi:hypothetical protein
MYSPAVVRKLSKAAPAFAVAVALTLVIAGAGAAAGQISLTAIDATYDQHFDSLASSGLSDVLPEGWALNEVGTSGANDGKYAAGTGSNTAGDTYSFGSVADPANELDAPYAVSVDWGDGTAATAFSAPATGALPAQSHTYADNGSYTVTVTATDDDGGSGHASFGIAVANVAPTGTFVAPATTPAGFAFTIAITGASDPSPVDTSAGFRYAFDCGDESGYSAFDTPSSRSCSTSTTGTRTVKGKIRDKDGGVSEYTATVQVVVTFDSLCALVRSYALRTRTRRRASWALSGTTWTRRPAPSRASRSRASREHS